MKKTIFLIFLSSLILFTGCSKPQGPSTEEMLNAVQHTTYIEPELKKELGDEDYNYLIDQAAMSIKSIYDFPTSITPEKRQEVIENLYLPEKIPEAETRSLEIDMAYTVCTVSLGQVLSASKGEMKGMQGYRVQFSATMTTDKGNEEVTYESIMVIDGNGDLKAYWAQPQA